MCRSKNSGGRRCESHTPTNRRTGRAAQRVFGGDTPLNRTKVGALPDEFVYGTIAERSHIAATTDNVALLDIAAKDRKPPVVEAALARKAELVDQQFTSPDADTRMNAVSRFGHTVPIPDALVADRSSKVRSTVAARTTDPAQLEALAHDDNQAVREAVLSNTAAPDTALQTLADRGDPYARDTLDKQARRRGEEPPPLSPAELQLAHQAEQAQASVLDEQRKTQDQATRQADLERPLREVISNRKATADEVAMAYASDDATGSVKRGLAAHQSASDAMRSETYDSQPTHVKRQWATRQVKDPALLDRLSKERDADIRMSVAANEHASDSTLLRYAQAKRDTQVRRAARMNLAQRRVAWE